MKKSLVKLLGIIAIVSLIGVLIVNFATADDNIENPAVLLFNEDFNGTSLDSTKWELCPNLDRQGRSTWMDDMVSVRDGFLHISFRRDSELGSTKTNDRALANNWIRSGGIRTRSKDWQRILYQNTFGYYEARIKFPKISGIWGAFWLMSPTIEQDLTNGGEEGTEIDIVETINSHRNQYQAALHWNGYGAHHKHISSTNRPVNIYDGEFHLFAVHWTPAEYVFYVDNREFWRVDGSRRFQNCGINQNPNYIKLTVESGSWAGDIPRNFAEGEMVVDYVRVYNRKP